MFDLDPLELLGSTEALSALVTNGASGRHSVGDTHLDLRCVLSLLSFLELLDEGRKLILGHIAAPDNAPSQAHSSCVEADLFQGPDSLERTLGLGERDRLLLRRVAFRPFPDPLDFQEGWLNVLASLDVSHNLYLVIDVIFIRLFLELLNLLRLRHFRLLSVGLVHEGLPLWYLRLLSLRRLGCAPGAAFGSPSHLLKLAHSSHLLIPFVHLLK